MSANGFLTDPGGPGIGLFPGRTIIPMRMREQAAVKGETYLVDFAASDAGGDVTSGASPGGDDSPFANMVPDTGAAARELRIGFFGVALDNYDEDSIGRFLFRGIMGLDKAGQAAETNPADGFLVVASSGNVGVGNGMVWLSGGELQPDALAGAGVEQKVIARNMILQTAPTTAVFSGGWFNGIEGFGPIAP